MSVQDSSSLPQVRPTGDDRAAWRNFWEQSGRSWRTEPEISEERQQYLSERRAIMPDIEKGIYPFKEIKLDRADVEWILSTHENGRGPVDWSDESQRDRKGLDLRGALLQYVDLKGLPLVGMRGGLHRNAWLQASTERCEAAAVHLERADLRFTHLEGADLHYAHLETADLRSASLKQLDLTKARLQEGDLNDTHFEDADLSDAHFEGAYLGAAHLERARLFGAHLENAHLRETHLEGATLCEAFFDSGTQLIALALGSKRVGFASLADIRWGDTNLAVVDWASIAMLGDENEARQPKKQNGSWKDTHERLHDYQRAVRANRQLAVALQAQGLNEDAACFAYRAQKLQRVVMRFQHKYIQYLFSLLLDLLAGYGYRPIRTLLWYVLVVGVFAAAYALSGHLPALPDALVYSLTSFHGAASFLGWEAKQRYITHWSCLQQGRQ